MFGFPSHHGFFSDPWSSRAHQQRVPNQWDSWGSSSPWDEPEDPWQQRVRGPAAHTQRPRGHYATQAELEQQARQQQLARQQLARQQQLAKEQAAREQAAREQLAREQFARAQLARQRQAAAARMRPVPWTTQPEPLVPPTYQQQQAAAMPKQRQQPFPERSSDSCSSNDSYYSTSDAETDDSADSYSEPMECCSSPPAPPAAAAAAAATIPQHPKQQASAPCSKLSPAAAAGVIQAAWRMSRLARHRPALKQLAAAAAQLRDVSSRLESAMQEAAAAGVGLTQKQYLELSEPVMKVLFALDAISCGPAVELRTIRKRLTNDANALLDKIQTVYKSPPPAVPAQQQQQQQQQEATPAVPNGQPAQRQQHHKLRRHKSKKMKRLSIF